MAKTKVSEWDVVADNNQDISGITLGTGMPPSYVNDSIREMMAQIKDWQSGNSGDGWTSTGEITSNGSLAINGNLTINGSSGTSGQVLVSQGLGATPIWGNAFVRGMIMIWAGTINSIPSGWTLCDGTHDTPNLTDRFVIGAGTTHVEGSKGGSANAVVVSHNHTATSRVTDPGHNHGMVGAGFPDTFSSTPYVPSTVGTGPFSPKSWKQATGISVSTSVNAKGESGTNKNLPPYYALAYIMKV